jgi:hypothetical protein
MQDLINKYFFALFLVTYIFGLLFYNTIFLLTGFQWTDEICALILLIAYLYVVFRSKDWSVNKAFLVTLFVFFFYMAYSFKIGSNSTKAILMDFIIQMKPYLVFFCVYQLKPRIEERQKVILNQLSLAIWVVILLPLGIFGFINERNFIMIIEHPTNFAAAVIVTAMIYLFTSQYTLKNRLIFIGLLLLGLASGRSKFYGFLVIASALVLYFDTIDKIKLNTKNVCVVLLTLFVTALVARNKIEFYFVQGVSTDIDVNYIARFVLYQTSFSIFSDYFPFGSGFATFGTYTSGVFYSDIYIKYGIDSVWGLSKSYSSFISDTYYPSLAQFGVVGVVLYFTFWVYVVRRALSLHANRHLRYFTITLAIICFFLIENIADSTFTGNRGMVIMLFLGYIMSNLYHENNKVLTAMQETDETN